MNSAVQNEYLVTEVMTATPQKLQLMLIEAAIRATLKAKKLRGAQQEVAAGDAILQAQEIVTQLIAGLNPDPQAAIARRLASVYNFIFRSLVQAHVRQNNTGLDEALRILLIERETWQQACKQFGSTQSTPPMTPHLAANRSNDAVTSSGMSLEA
jgi:flagellar secretion chaperone FliS